MYDTNTVHGVLFKIFEQHFDLLPANSTKTKKLRARLCECVLLFFFGLLENHPENTRSVLVFFILWTNICIELAFSTIYMNISNHIDAVQKKNLICSTFFLCVISCMYAFRFPLVHAIYIDETQTHTHTCEYRRLIINKRLTHRARHLFFPFRFHFLDIIRSDKISIVHLLACAPIHSLAFDKPLTLLCFNILNGSVSKQQL